MRTLKAAALLILSFALSGCPHNTPVASELDHLATAPLRMVLFSLDPTKRQGYATHNATVFHGVGILGRAEITDPREEQALLRALAQAARDSDGVATMCFKPRHALHLEDSTHSIDLSICFECLSVEVRGFNHDQGFSISASQEHIFDESVARHHLPPCAR